MDPGATGAGIGLAGMDQVFHIFGAAAVNINITATFTFDTGYTFQTLLPALTASVNDYFAVLNSKWSTSDYLIVRMSQIEAALISVEGVLDVQNMTLNAGSTNISLGQNEIAALGAISNG
jgi:uncharacterized phage protein gp47/JayE